jgi:LPXTG-motif cell wall-anchored protein
MINLYVSPGDTKIPSDRLIVEVATKKMIWLVWLGTILIILGGSIGIFNSRKRKTA